MSVSGIDESRLTVLLDIRQPQAYLGLQPAATFAADLGIEINWLPVTVPPLKAPSAPRANEDRGTRHRRLRAEAVAREIATYADVQKLVLRDYYRAGCPEPFNLSWLWVRERHPARLLDYLQEAFCGYWACELDVADDEAVADHLADFGLDGGFEPWKRETGARTASTIAREIAERGVLRAPAYLVENEVFVGRQHLPMIRWILDGRRGRGPI